MLKVGLSCTSGCNLSDTTVDVYDDAGQRIGRGILGSEPWQETIALYWTELQLVAPEREGDVSLHVRAALALPHADATSVVRFVVSRQPEHRVTLRVTDKATGVPLAGVELRLGRPPRPAACRTPVERSGTPPGTRATRWDFRGS
jgi:hypothetical protein